MEVSRAGARNSCDHFFWRNLTTDWVFFVCVFLATGLRRIGFKHPCRCENLRSAEAQNEVTHHLVLTALNTGPGYKKYCTLRNASTQYNFFSKKRRMGYCLGT